MARIWILGGGVIGAGWAVLYGAEGHTAVVIDPAPGAADAVAAAWTSAQPILGEMGLLGDASLAPTHAASAEAAGPAPDLVQECLPERLDLKHEVLAAIEPLLPDGVMIASSSSGLLPDDIGARLTHPGRLVIAHPNNPPWIMPTVELCPSRTTAPERLEELAAFYTALGKSVIRMNKPIVGHVVNRLQAALWREAIHLAAEGVVSLSDTERAISEGLAPRWGLYGPSTIFHLAGGAGGMERFLQVLGPAFQSYFDDLGTPVLDHATAELLVREMQQHDARPVAEIAAERNRKVPRAFAEIARIRANEN